MSNPARVTAEQAFKTLRENVYEPAFFAKLAAHGRRPANLAEAQAYLEMGDHCLAAHTQEEEKAASATLTRLQNVNARLRGEPAQPAAGSYTESAYLKQAAQELSQKPEIVAAVLAWQAAAAGIQI